MKKMSLIYLHHVVDFRGYDSIISFFSFATKRLAYEGATLVPIAVHEVCK